MRPPGLGNPAKKKRTRFQWTHWSIIIIVLSCIFGFTVVSIIVLSTQGVSQGTTILTIVSIIVGVIIGLLGLLLSYLQWKHPQSTVPEPMHDPLVSLSSTTEKQKSVMIYEEQQKKLSSTNSALPVIPAPPTTSRPPISDGLPRVDWGESPQGGAFYGREKEIHALTNWIIDDDCRLVALVGIGGIGKTVLAARVADQAKDAFAFVFWRSLQNAPPLKNILQTCIKFISNQTEINLSEDTNHQISLLLDYLRAQRCLLILDNIETIMEGNNRKGLYKAGYEDYGQLFQRIGEAKHQSCLLLTSREKPKEIAKQEGITSCCRSLQLAGLDSAGGSIILEDKALQGTRQAFDQLIENYVGNPLALKLVSQFIKEAFDGNVENFLSEGDIIFSDIKDVLDQQFERLSPLEQDVMYWLAIEQEASTLQTIQKNSVSQPSIRELQEALRSLRRRSMVETSRAGLLLQNVIMQYMIDRLVNHMTEACQKNDLHFLNTYALLKGQSRDYVRESQTRLILAPLSQKLCTLFVGEELDNMLSQLLILLRANPPLSTFYAAGNILTIAIYMQIKLGKLNFSHLTIKQIYLQGIALQNVDFSYAHFIDCIFTDTFGSVLSVEFNADGGLLAIGTTNGQVKIWDTVNGIPLITCIGHTDWVRSVDFAPNGQIVASGSEDQTIRLWDRQTGYCLKTLSGHINWIRTVHISQDGQTLASGSDDHTVRIWNIQTGECIRVLEGHTNHIYSIAYSSDGQFIVSGSEDQTIGLWDVQTGNRIYTLHGHTNRIRSVAFSPDGQTFASGSEDQTVRLWDRQTGECINVFQGHTNIIWAITYSPDGSLLASGSHDQTIRFWEISSKQCIKVFQGYNSWVRSIAYNSTGNILASDSHGTNVRLWDTRTGESLRILTGPTNFIWSVAYNTDGQFVGCGSEDQKVHIWNAFTGKSHKSLSGHTSWVRAVAFSPDGQLIASGSEDQTVRIWNVHTGKCLHVLQGHTNWVRSVSFSPNGQTLASGGDDNTAQIWDVASGRNLLVLRGHTSWVWSVAFNPTGTLLASGSHDHTIRLWDVASAYCKTILSGHTDWVWSVAFSPDGQILASGSHDRTIRLWDIEKQTCVKVFVGHADWIQSVAFNPDGQTLASGCIDGAVNIWDVSTGRCLHTLVIDRPYERLNITGAHGLTDLQKETIKLLGAYEE